MYKLIQDQTGRDVSVFNTETGGFIPFDPANTDFQEYQRWLAEGNTPAPAEEQPE